MSPFQMKMVYPTSSIELVNLLIISFMAAWEKTEFFYLKFFIWFEMLMPISNWLGQYRWNWPFGMIFKYYFYHDRRTSKGLFEFREVNVISWIEYFSLVCHSWVDCLWKYWNFFHRYFIYLLSQKIVLHSFYSDP